MLNSFSSINPFFSDDKISQQLFNDKSSQQLFNYPLQILVKFAFFATSPRSPRSTIHSHKLSRYVSYNLHSVTFTFEMSRKCQILQTVILHYASAKFQILHSDFQYVLFPFSLIFLRYSVHRILSMIMQSHISFVSIFS